MTRVRAWVPWLLLVLATALLSALLAGTQTGEPLDPANAGPDGTQALASVLREQGVQVDVVRGLAGLSDRPTGPGTTVLLAQTAYLGPDAGQRLLDRVRGADRLVVLVAGATERPGPALGLDLKASAGTGAQLSAECTSPLVRDGDQLSRWEVSLQTAPGRADVSACYPPSPGHNAGGAKAGALLTFAATRDQPEIMVVGFPSALTNAHITQDAHAALGLRLLGHSPRLVWLIPQPGDAGAQGAASLWDVLPRNMTPSLVILSGALLALAVWRGRRLGPVVTEPLPAVVQAAQTTRSRGRLYRQAHDRDHALAALQAGTQRRLAPRLGLPRASRTSDLVRAVSDATGRPQMEIEKLLTDPHTADDPTFVTTARELRSLEEGLHP